METLYQNLRKRFPNYLCRLIDATIEITIGETFCILPGPTYYFLDDVRLTAREVIMKLREAAESYEFFSKLNEKLSPLFSYFDILVTIKRCPFFTYFSIVFDFQGISFEIRDVYGTLMIFSHNYLNQVVTTERDCYNDLTKVILKIVQDN